MRNLIRTSGVFLAAALAVAAASCAPVRVNASLERGMDFTRYNSFAFAADDRFSTGDPRLDNNEFFETRLRETARDALVTRGFEEVSPGAADLVIHYHANVTQAIDVNALDREYGYYNGSRSSIYDAGTITIDFVDSHTNRLVWRGWAEGSLDGIENQDLIEHRVTDAVTRILQKLPPRL
jgi:hypothetical protein